MHSGDIHLAFTINNDYVRPASVAAHTAWENLSSSGSNLVFHILDVGLRDDGRASLAATLEKLGEVYIYPPPRDLDLSRRVFGMTEECPIAALGKLYLSEVLSDEVARVIYLDTDVLVMGDISSLMERDTGPFGLGAVKDLCIPDRRVDLIFDGADVAVVAPPIQGRDGALAPGYFNVGMLVIELERWRELKVYETATDLVSRLSSKMVFPDQDILNAIFAGNWQELPSQWNKMVGCPWHDQFGEKRTSTILECRGIVHFAGWFKPWTAEYPDGPLKEIYREAAVRAGWGQIG